VTNYKPWGSLESTAGDSDWLVCQYKGAGVLKYKEYASGKGDAELKVRRFLSPAALILRIYVF